MMNVALLSMQIGARLGLQTTAVRELGTIAALHDIGRASRPDIEWASPEGATATGLHLESVRRLTALRTGGAASLARTVVAFECGLGLSYAEQHPYGSSPGGPSPRWTPTPWRWRASTTSR
jgi:hypothetical protein